MDNIRQAVERARAAKLRPLLRLRNILVWRDQVRHLPGRYRRCTPKSARSRSSPAFLQSKRIVAYNGADQRSRPYDMLRTQVLQSMVSSGWKILGMTSPTPGCGKTLTALNLAFSIARQPDQSVVIDRFGFPEAASRRFSRINAGCQRRCIGCTGGARAVSKRNCSDPRRKSAHYGITDSGDKGIVGVNGLAADAKSAAGHPKRVSLTYCYIGFATNLVE